MVINKLTYYDILSTSISIVRIYFIVLGKKCVGWNLSKYIGLILDHLIWMGDGRVRDNAFLGGLVLIAVTGALNAWLCRCILPQNSFSIYLSRSGSIASIGVVPTR